MKNIAQIFEDCKNDSRLNTSYPLCKTNWDEYKTAEKLPFAENDMCFYIHIPFCRSLCKFCEYIKFKAGNNEDESHYLDILQRDIEAFLKNRNKITLHGFDIGGGTPTSISIANFERLMSIYRSTIGKCNLADDFESSIESTFATIDEEKMAIIANAGFKRISFGMQTINDNFLKANNRQNGSFEQMQKVLEMCAKYGITTRNIDIMYGFAAQTERELQNTLAAVNILHPENITVYELRTNMLSHYSIKSKEELYNQYCFLYDTIKRMGYQGHFGQNTFSIKDDFGVSSYLRNRMLNNASYKGFGIAAQSKSKSGISYNYGKNGQKLDNCLELNSFENADVYLLPKSEMLAKYMAICGYCGIFKLSIMQNVLQENPLDVFADEFTFLFNNNLLERKDDNIYISPQGFKYYGAVLSLFYKSI